MSVDYPQKFQFYNRGVSGNRVLDLYARIVNDTLNLKPDVLSILIGVNDIWHGLDWQNGTGLARYEKIYNILIEELKEELPDCKIMILEPFVLKGRATENREDQPDRWQIFNSGVKATAEIARRVAEKHSVKFVELQKHFDKACEKAEPSYWLADGVHPTPVGHELITREWIKAFEEINE